jgi:tetratricopeptide (TPR) repeat protein
MAREVLAAMPHSVRWKGGGIPPLLAALLLAATTRARSEFPSPHVPARPPTQQELDRAEAQKQFALGALREHDSRFLEAVRAYEEAARLDPDAQPVHVARARLYFALDRAEDGIAAARKAVELDPDDYDTAYLLARQLRGLDRPREAAEVLAGASARPGLKDDPQMNAQLHYELGGLCEQTGDLAGAERAFGVVLSVLDEPAALLEQGNFNKEEVAQQAADTCERLARVCLKAGRADRAARALEAARRKDPQRSARLAYNLAEVLAGQDKNAEALACLDDYLQTQPQGMEGYELKITLLKKLGKEADVLPALERAAARDAHNVALHLLLAREYRRVRRPADAEAVYKAQLAEGGGVEVYRGLLGLYKEEGTPGGERALTLLDEAIKAAGKPGQPGDASQARAILQALRQDPELVRLMLPAVRDRLRRGKATDFRTQMLFATLAARTRQLDAAEELYRGCLNQPGGPKDMETDVYLGLLQVLGEGQKHEEIVAVCRKGLAEAQQTNRVVFHREMSRSLAAVGKADDAIEAADDAVRESVERDKPSSRRNRAWVLSRLGRHKEAVAECRALLKEYNGAQDVRSTRLLLSSVYSAAAEADEAEAQLLLVLKDDPNDAGACNDLAYLWAERNKKLDEAERLVRKALDLDRRQRQGGPGLELDEGDNAAYVDSLGWVLFRRGKLEEARGELERAAALPGGADDPVVWDHLGDVYFRLGLKGKSAEAWRKARGLYEAGRRHPDEHYQEIKEKLRLLEP